MVQVTKNDAFKKVRPSYLVCGIFGGNELVISKHCETLPEAVEWTEGHALAEHLVIIPTVVLKKGKNDEVK